MDKLHDIIVQPAKPFRALTPRDPLILRPWLMQPSGPGSHQAPLAQLQEARIAPGCLRAKLFSRLFYYYFTKYYFLLSPFSPSLLHLSSFSSCPTSSLLHPSSLSLSPEVVFLSFSYLYLLSLPLFSSSISASSGYLVWLLSCLRLGILIYLPRLDQDGAPKVLWHDGASTVPDSVDRRDNGFPSVRL